MTMTDIWFTAIENYVRHNESRTHGVGWVRGWFEKLWGWVGLGKVLCRFGWVWENFPKIPGVGAGLGKNCVGLGGFGDQ